jgi:predicted ester cyclase
MATTTRQSCAELFERETTEVWNGDRLDVIEELYAPEFESRTTRAGGGTATLGDRAAIKSMHAEWDAAFPDMEIEVTTIVEDGDTVMAAWEARGTHEGTFRGIEPTGRGIDVQGFSYRRAEGGRYVAATDTVSMMNMLAQLGVDLPLKG